MLDRVRHHCDRTLSLARRLEWLGPLLARVTLGLVFVTTGWGKLHHLDGVAAFFGQLGIPAPAFHAALVAGVELIGGALILLGLATRIAAAALVGVMAVAIYTAKLPALHGLADLAATTELAYLAMFAWLALAGAGPASLDHAVRRFFARPPAITVS